MTDEPVELDARRGMAAQKATDLRRALADIDANAKELRIRQSQIERRVLATRPNTWPEVADNARYVLSLYAASLDPQDTHHRDLIVRILDDFLRLTEAQRNSTEGE